MGLPSVAVDSTEAEFPEHRLLLGHKITFHSAQIFHNVREDGNLVYLITTGPKGRLWGRMTELPGAVIVDTGPRGREAVSESGPGAQDRLARGHSCRWGRSHLDPPRWCPD